MAAYTRLVYRVAPAFPAQLSIIQLATRTVTTKRRKLTESERATALAPLLSAGWTMVEGRDAITKKFTFKDFNKAWGWMSRVALQSEKHDHHPEWSNVYNSVTVTWSTHDCNGLSKKDVTLATFCDKAHGTD